MLADSTAPGSNMLTPTAETIGETWALMSWQSGARGSRGVASTGGGTSATGAREAAACGCRLLARLLATLVLLPPVIGRARSLPPVEGRQSSERNESCVVGATFLSKPSTCSSCICSSLCRSSSRSRRRSFELESESAATGGRLFPLARLPLTRLPPPMLGRLAPPNERRLCVVLCTSSG